MGLHCGGGNETKMVRQIEGGGLRKAMATFRIQLTECWNEPSRKRRTTFPQALFQGKYFAGRGITETASCREASASIPYQPTSV